MIHVMDQHGRILAINCRFYPRDSDSAGSKSAEELLVGLLQQLPAGTFLRGPYINFEEEKKK